MSDLAIELMTATFAAAIPFAVVFAIGDLIVSTFLRVAFGGKVWFGK